MGEDTRGACIHGGMRDIMLKTDRPALPCPVKRHIYDEQGVKSPPGLSHQGLDKSSCGCGQLKRRSPGSVVMAHVNGQPQERAESNAGGHYWLYQMQDSH